MRLKALICTITFCILLCACGSDPTDNSQIVLTTGFEEGELFYVGDNKCYVPEAKVYIRNLEDGYESVYGEDIMERSVGDTSVSDKLTSMALSRLAEVKALGILASDRDITLSERDIEKCGKAADRYMGSLSDADRKDLEITPELLLSMYEDYALAYNVYNDITKDVNPEISDDEARIITIQRILIPNGDEEQAAQTANIIYAKLSEGEGFDTLTDEYNGSGESKYSFGKDTDDFPPDFVNACFELSTDEVSSPIVTDEGISIVKCLSSYDRERTDANKIRLVNDRKSEAFDKVYSSFVKELQTNFNSELWNGQELSDRKLDSEENFFRIYDDVFGSPDFSKS